MLMVRRYSKDDLMVLVSPKMIALNHHCRMYFLRGMRKRKPNIPPHTSF